jgi:dipeptidyl aminopeptidase/acylaminoacyl peptidase
MSSGSRALAYFALGSVAVGTVFGLGFTVNWGGKTSAIDHERRRNLGPSQYFTLDGISGSLTYHAKASRTIVFVHGRGANWAEAFPIAHRFYTEGFNVAFWEREGNTIRYGREGVLDVLRVVEHVRKMLSVDTNKIFVLGLSLGAAMALGAAAADDGRHIAAVVADSSYGNLKAAAFRYVTAFGHIPKIVAWPTAFVMLKIAETVHHIEFESCNPSEWARRIRCPVLLIHGREDWRVPWQESACIFEATSSPKELWLVENAGHTQSFYREPHEYVRRVIQFTTFTTGA